MDYDTKILFGIKAYLKGETPCLPTTDQLEASARQLVADEYKNLTGLPRLGPSNGLCPYSPYEDLAKNSSRFAEMTQKLNTTATGTARHPYELFYYFYNNELIYQYNKFCELAPVELLKAINQPDVFAFLKRYDSVYTERSKTDTLHPGQVRPQEVSRSLTGFATNNMVLLLDVSGSMDSPVKLPLLKRSIKSLLTLLRPEDQLSIVVYSGKARVVLKPTSGANIAEITRAINELQSTGDTDGDGGIRLAYKVATKSYVRAGNNRIVLATDGDFSISDQVLQLIEERAREDIYLTVFTFGLNAHIGQGLKKLSQLGRGSYAHVTAETAEIQLIMEAQAKPQPAK